MKLSSEQKQIMDWRMQAFALQGVGTHNAWLMRKAGQYVNRNQSETEGNYE